MNIIEKEYAFIMSVADAAEFEKFRYHWPGTGITVVLGLKDETWSPVVIEFEKNIFQDAETCQRWYDEHPIDWNVPEGMLEEAYYAELKDVEIFEAGTAQSGDIDSEEDLDHIIGKFDELRESDDARHEVPLVVSHDEDNPFMQADSMPAAGWVNRLYRKGKKLFMEVAEVPKLIADLIEKKALVDRSVEIYTDYEDKQGEHHGFVLRRVALLGAAIPKIRSLSDHLALYGEPADGFTVYHHIPPVDNQGKEPSAMKTYSESDVKEAKEAAAQEARDALVQEFAEKHGMKPEDAVAKLQQMEQDQREKAEADRKAAIAAFGEDLKKAGLAPVVVDTFLKIRESIPDTDPVAKFAEDGEELSPGQFIDTLMQDIASKAKEGNLYVPFDEKGKTKHEPADGDGEDPENVGQKERAEKYAEENKVSYADALRVVRADDRRKSE